jgi:phage shock protein PspC (stress-responsive transcriptional regulator)
VNKKEEKQAPKPKEKVSSEEKKDGPQVSKLCRSEKDKVIGGVAGGLGEFFNIDPIIFRILFVLFALNGFGFIFYFALWIIIPSEKRVGKNTDENIRYNIEEIKDRANNLAADIREGREKERSRNWIGIVLILLGFFFLLENFGLFRIVNLARFWPLFIIVLGFAILLKDGKRN